MKLYHYVHCPFCIRVRLACGFLGISYKSIVLSYEDETTPISLTGVKMLPIVQWDDGSFMNESLDIVAQLDKEKKLILLDSNIEEFLNDLGTQIHSLAMPYWIFTPEFNQSSRSYFEKKKSIKRGPFVHLVEKQDQFINELRPKLDALESQLMPFYRSEDIHLDDLLLAAHLWGLYVVPEFQFSPALHRYLQMIKEKCHFRYWPLDLWNSEKC